METALPVPARTPAGNTATGWLKILALVFMFIDHAGKMLFPNVPEMRIIGRIAFPIYVWCMIVGFHYTRSVPKYLLRVLAVGIISQPLYYLALHHEYELGVKLSALLRNFSFPELGQFLRTLFVRPNIFLTLFLGLCAVWGVSGRKDPTHVLAPAAAAMIGAVLWIQFGWQYALGFWLLAALSVGICVLRKADAEKNMARFLVPAAALILATLQNTDYGWKGILLFILLYAVRDSRPGIAAVMTAYFMFWGAAYSITGSLFGLKFDVKKWPAFLSQPLSALLRMETYALLSLPLILIRFKKDLKMPRWVGYAIYPAHLLLLYILELIFRQSA